MERELLKEEGLLNHVAVGNRRLVPFSNFAGLISPNSFIGPLLFYNINSRGPKLSKSYVGELGQDKASSIFYHQNFRG